MFCNPQSRYTFVSEFSKFFPIVWCVHFCACLWSSYLFLINVLISLLIQGESKGLTVIILFGMVSLQNSIIFGVTISAKILTLSLFMISQSKFVTYYLNRS